MPASWDTTIAVRSRVPGSTGCCRRLPAGSRADDSLWRALRKEVKEMYIVGECFSPRLLYRSSLEGMKAGLAV